MPQVGIATYLQRWYIDPITGLGILGLTPSCMVSAVAGGSVIVTLVVSEAGGGLYVAGHTFAEPGAHASVWGQYVDPGGAFTIGVEFSELDVEGGVVIITPLAGTASYSGNPGASDLDWVRFTIADTGPSYGGDPWHFLDSEITGILALAADPLHAAVDLLLAWARQIGHNPNFNIGRFGEDYNAAAKFLQEKAKELLASAGAGVGIYVGGVSVSDKTSKEQNTDRTSPSFKRGMFSNPDAGW